jgi:hypothetical protein
MKTRTILLSLLASMAAVVALLVWLIASVPIGSRCRACGDELHMFDCRFKYYNISVNGGPVHKQSSEGMRMGNHDLFIFMYGYVHKRCRTPDVYLKVLLPDDTHGLIIKAGNPVFLEDLDIKLVPRTRPPEKQVRRGTEI